MMFVSCLVSGGCGDGPVSPTAAPGSGDRVIFVTSQAVTGDFGGVAAGDALCGTLALSAGLSGTYLAWLSDDAGQSPSASFTRGDAPFVMTSRVRVADFWSDLTDGTINNPIVVDELGRQPRVGTTVWTGTDAGGQPAASGETCGGWRSMSGSGQTGAFDRIDPGWTAAGPQPCAQPRRLYCVQQ